MSEQFEPELLCIGGASQGITGIQLPPRSALKLKFRIIVRPNAGAARFAMTSMVEAASGELTFVRYGTRPMSALGQKQTCAAQQAMSALCQ